MFYLTVRDVTTARRMSWRLGIFIRNILQPIRSLYDFRFKSFGSNSGFNVVDDIDLELRPMFYILSHV